MLLVHESTAFGPVTFPLKIEVVRVWAETGVGNRKRSDKKKAMKDKGLYIKVLYYFLGSGSPSRFAILWTKPVSAVVIATQSNLYEAKVSGSGMCRHFLATGSNVNILGSPSACASCQAEGCCSSRGMLETISFVKV